MTDQGVVVLGILIPSSSPLFLGLVAVHVVAGLICTFAGIVAMWAPKRAGRHPSAGTMYYWSLVVVFVTMTAFPSSDGQPTRTCLSSASCPSARQQWAGERCDTPG